VRCLLQVAIALIDIQGLGDSRNASEAIDNLLMYVGLQICNLQIINVRGEVLATEFAKISVSDYLVFLYMLIYM